MTTLKDVLHSDKHEEWVQYFVFPGGGGAEGGEQDLEEQLFALNAAAQTLIGDYIWHNEPFALKRSSQPLSSFDEEKEEETGIAQPPFFYGITHFADNLEDEWFIVYILRELSAQFPDIVVKVDDNDGEFLLIEAADHLPDWAESDESCKNRVFLYQGKVHLIPEEVVSTENVVKIGEGVDLIRTRAKDTLASKEIRDWTNKRIGNYPKKMVDNFHHVNVMLPPSLAVILREKPGLVAVGASAFYLRDPVSLKSARLMKTFQVGKKGLVKSRVRFTKCLYAMLMKQDFRPDTRSSWPFPSALSADYKSHSLGVKLTTGFEILLGQCQNPSISNGGASNCEDGGGWFRYETALKKTGYFRGFMEGSKPHGKLVEAAKEFYRVNLQPTTTSSGEDSSWQGTVCQEVRHLLETVQVDGDKLREEGENLPQDDDDSWLSIRPEDLENLLEAKFQSGGLNPDDIPFKLKEFMKQISDFSGVESTGDATAASNNSDSPTSTGIGSPRIGTAEGKLDGFGEPFDFKADDFVTAVEKLLHDLGAPDKEWEASDDDYGGSDEEELDLESMRKMQNFSKESQEYFSMLDQMDNELAGTNVGKTFKKTINATAATEKSASSSKAKATAATTASVEELEEYDEEEGLTPVDIDMNALANMLESFQSQTGPSGPSANLLKTVGFDMSRVKKQ